MGEAIELTTSDSSTYLDDQGRHMDIYGRMLLVGIFSDLCRERDQESDQYRISELASIAERRGKVLERYDPAPNSPRVRSSSAPHLLNAS
jgi:hypothetical protein